MKRTTYLAIATLVVMLVLAPAALAQDAVEGKTTYMQQNGKQR